MQSPQVQALSRTLRFAAAVVAVTLPIPLAANAAPADPVGQVCVQVVGLSPGEKHYQACVESLTQSLRSRQSDRGVAAARQACLAQGLPPESAALSECELQAPPAPEAGAGPAGAIAVPGGTRSYFLVSRQTAFQRDQLACARLGFEPAGGDFDQCAVDLRAALNGASNSMM